MRIGFVGLGIMGRPMALNLLRAGHTVTVWARRPESVAPLQAAGAAVAASLPELATGQALVISMVADAPDVAEVMRGEPLRFAMRRADDALYAAKNAGRDCVREAEPAAVVKPNSA